MRFASLGTNGMKGVSPVVSVTLLIAVAIIGVMATWFWVSSYTSKPPLPETIFKGYTVMHAYLNASGTGCNRLDLQGVSGVNVDYLELYVKDYTTLKAIGANGTNPLNPAYINVTSFNATAIGKYYVKGLNVPFSRDITANDWYAYDEGKGAAVDSQNSVISVGVINDNGYIIKYNRYGTVQWNVSLNYTYLEDVAADYSNNVIAVGEFNHSASHTNDVNAVFYVIKYDANGAHQWNKTFACQNRSTAYGVAVDHSNNIIATGGCWNASGNSSYITIKMNSLGTEIWRNYTPVNDWGAALDVIVDSGDEAAIVTGWNYSYTTAELTSGQRVYTVKYNLTTGGLMWSNTYVITYAIRANRTSMGLALRSDGNLYLAYSTEQYYIRVINASNGNFKNTITTIMDFNEDVALDRLNNIIVVGQIIGVKHGSKTWTQKFNSNSTSVWFTLLPSDNADSGNAVIPDNNTDVYVVGGTDSGFTVGAGMYTVKLDSGTGDTVYNTISIPKGAYFLKSNRGGYNTQSFRCPS